ncbi:cytochrome P450 2J6-like [Amphiura filiformis]|uniref:cytochrome P450 2J6-like n=1 Tax=Amphiura filiformis TaxID=82378 RepID=UPI003B2284A3
MSYFELFLPIFNVQTILVLFAIYLLSSYGFRRRKNLPPGPWCVPLLGNLPILALNLYRTGKEPEQLFADMAKKYGEVFSMKIGTKLIVVANGLRSIKETSQDPRVNGRPRSTLFEEIEYDEAIPFTTGKSWKYQRTFVLNTFRAFGVGRTRFEGNIIKEATTLVDDMRNTKGGPFDPHTLIANCVSNVICSVVLGRRYDHSDSVFKRLILLLNQVTHDLGTGILVPFLPVAKYIFAQRYKSIVSSMSELRKFITTIVDEHRQTFDKDNMKDIVDVFLNEIELAKIETGDRVNHIHLKSLIATTTVLFSAGTETSTSTLRWALLYMMNYPEIQKRVHQEIDAVVGPTCKPQWVDRSLLPYTEAVLLEIQRIRTVVAASVPRVASEDTKLVGYDIPKGTAVVFNHWAVHNDPDVWAEPEQFRPERFVDDDGKLRHREELMPFSKGHRQCPGENLAKMEIFLFFTYILHSFTITKPSDAETPSMKGISGIVLSPTPYQIVITERI